MQISGITACVLMRKIATLLYSSFYFLFVVTQLTDEILAALRFSYFQEISLFQLVVK